MATVQVVHVDARGLAGMVRRRGVIVEVRRGYKAKVQATGDAKLADMVAAACAHADVPDPGDAFDSGAEYAQLCAEDFDFDEPAATGAANTYLLTFRVIYRLQRRYLDFPLRGGSTLHQVRTYTDRNGAQIDVTYKGKKYVPRAGVDAMVPQTTLYAEFVEETDAPVDLVNERIGHVNDSDWHGLPANCWLVTGVQFDCVDESTDPPRFRFLYQVESTTTAPIAYGTGSKLTPGWQPVVVYHNPDGSVPADVITENGFKIVEWFPGLDFDSYFWNA